jgi:GT2 family glycosyltransferase
MKIAVLITCHNRKIDTLNCLDSLFNILVSENSKFDVYLVDDGSSDGTREAVSLNYPNVNLIIGDGNLFWNRGMRLAWEVASENEYDFYLWLNDDIVLKDNSLKVLFSDYNYLKSNSIVAGVCESKSGAITYSGYLKTSKIRRLMPQENPVLCDFFNGNIVLVPKGVFELVGNLDPIYPHAQGDFDYGLRAKELGVQSYISSKVIGVCERHNDFPKWCNPKINMISRFKAFKGVLGGRPKSTFIFEKRHYGTGIALFHYLTIHLRLLFPSYWSNKKKSYI